MHCLDRRRRALAGRLVATLSDFWLLVCVSAAVSSSATRSYCAQQTQGTKCDRSGWHGRLCDVSCETIVTGLAGAVTALGVLALAGLIVVYSGFYIVAATEEHSSIVRWLFETAFHTSIERNAEGIDAPETLTPKMVAAGAAE